MDVTDEMVGRLAREIASDELDLGGEAKGVRDSVLQGRWRDYERRARRYLTAALSDKQAGEVQIKPLEWKDVDGDIVGLVALARTSFDTYFIERDPEGYVLKLGSIGLLPHQTFEAAKAAAQSDCETRIRSALVDVPAVEPVGYTTQWSLDEVRAGRLGTTAPADTMRPESEIPLYTSLPLSREGEDSAEVGRKFKLGDRVTKTKGSSWQGHVVGFYSTALTAVGYAVESEREPGSVQIYPESALAAMRGGTATTQKGGDHGPLS